MTQSEAQAAVMITDIEDVEQMWADVEDIEIDQPEADSTEGDEVYLGITNYS
jgi:hypothetical protein